MTTTERLRRDEWHVRPVEHREAVAVIEATHYAKGAPNTSVARHGLFADVSPDACVGVALWLPPTKRAAEAVGGEMWRGVLALSRLCIFDDVPRNAASFLLSRAMRALDRARWPILLTYADTAEGHTGAIYLASGWMHDADMPGSDAWRHVETGERRGRKRGKRNLSVAEMAEAGFERIARAPKRRFVHRLERAA